MIEGTKDPQFVTIKGTEGKTHEHECDEDFQDSAKDVLCTFKSSVNIGDYRCVVLRIKGNDGLELRKVIGQEI